MDRNAFVEVMNDASGMLEAGLAEEALARLTAFDDGLDAAPEPKDYGWIVSYRFRSAFAAGDYAQALHLAEHGPARFPADIPPATLATMYSMAVEAATQQGLADSAILMADRCIELRRGHGEHSEVLMAAMTACTLLGDLERHDLASRYAQLLITEGVGHDDYRGYGYYALCAAIESGVGAHLIDTLRAGREWLESQDNEFARVALEYLETAPALRDPLAVNTDLADPLGNGHHPTDPLSGRAPQPESPGEERQPGRRGDIASRPLPNGFPTRGGAAQDAFPPPGPGSDRYGPVGARPDRFDLQPSSNGFVPLAPPDGFASPSGEADDFAPTLAADHFPPDTSAQDGFPSAVPDGSRGVGANDFGSRPGGGEGGESRPGALGSGGSLADSGGVLDSMQTQYLRVGDGVPQATGGAKQPPAAQLAGGETADALMDANRPGIAAAAYRALIDDAISTGQPDPLIMGKATLGLLTALIFDNRVGEAHSVWVDEQGPTYLGIWSLENGQTSVHDAIAYNLVAAFLHSLSTGDPNAANHAVDALMTRNIEWAYENDTQAVPAMINTWRRHLLEIHSGEPAPEYRWQLTQAEQRWGHPVPEGGLYWMRPYRWIVDWV
ncbi:hypothetical protein [Nocardia sp. CDC160]|uniref:hypothetical protein n=1 Tax=Nocardia sp. CDC160 TaxID=3112166 RepID=UPI002DBDF61F|nr:hypothetical protein [Nocardia sp. CDC160]MEC3917200.1 hypothetical protein [Nocardia sp. CDC160]